MLPNERQHVARVVPRLGPRDGVQHGQLVRARAQLGRQRAHDGHQGFQGLDEVVHVEDVLELAVMSQCARCQ